MYQIKMNIPFIYEAPSVPWLPLRPYWHCRYTRLHLFHRQIPVRGEKRNVSICGRPENDWLFWLSKRYDEVGESDLEKRNVYIALHWAYILASFERRSNGLLYIEGRIGEISGLFTGYSPWTFPDQLSYTKIVKRIGLCKWSGGVPDALPFFILSKLFHIDNIWYICDEINTVYYD